ncbi:MAG: tetratricopeptide repeat protein [Gemmatimonadales bacterium]
MYSTDQFRVFSGAPMDRLLSRPRRLLQEGRLAEAESGYQALLASNPDLKQVWIEYFELLRHGARHDDALALSDRATSQFGDDALPAALKGAALVELGRYRDGLESLDHAARLDPDLGLVWHEAGYAAFRIGELSRALMALDRAFALEPHGGTLHLRGRVLRQAGRYLAAEVAFEGAAEAAEFPAQRALARREIQRTRRYAAFPGFKPDTLPPARQWFAESGGVPLSGSQGTPATDHDLLRTFAQLAADLDWHFTALVALDGWDEWRELGAWLSIPVLPQPAEDASAIPLVAARAPGALASWAALVDQPFTLGRGLSFALELDRGAPAADVAGRLTGLAGSVEPALALETAQHPEGRLYTRTLR